MSLKKNAAAWVPPRIKTFLKHRLNEYGFYSIKEGFGTADLKDAKALLEELNDSPR